MAKTRSMTRNEERKRIKRCSVRWADLNSDILFLVMMKLGAIEFLVFSKVCKTWRSLALSKRTEFMATQPPMLMRVYDQDLYCFEDFEGRKFKTLLSCHSGSKSKSRMCVGLTCGYLIFFGRKTHDFWLVNPFTGHQLHFPNFHDFPYARLAYIGKAVLVFSPSISHWVFLFLNRITCKLWFSIAGGQQTWNSCFAPPHSHGLCAYKGKIYTMANSGLYEWTLDAKHNSMLSKAIILDNRSNHVMELVVAGENLYWMNLNPCEDEVVEVDLGKKEFIIKEKAKATIGEYAIFVKKMKGCGKVRTDTLTYPWSQLQHERYACFLDAHRIGETRSFHGNMWYFPHDSLNVNNLLEDGGARDDLLAVSDQGSPTSLVLPHQNQLSQNESILSYW